MPRLLPLSALSLDVVREDGSLNKRVIQLIAGLVSAQVRQQVFYSIYYSWVVLFKNAVSNRRCYEMPIRWPRLRSIYRHKYNQSTTHLYYLSFVYYLFNISAHYQSRG